MFTILPSLDVSTLEELDELVKNTCSHDRIRGYKVGFALGLTFGLPQIASRIQKWTSKPIIYDHQKAATDIPDTGKLFAKTLKNAGIQEAILFPQAGPQTMNAWIEALKEANLKVIVGGIMTHPGYLASEGGFLKDECMYQLYREAQERGCQNFVVPLTKPEVVQKIKSYLKNPEHLEVMSPGFGAQGGSPDALLGFGTKTIIVGRALIQAENKSLYIEKLASQLKEWEI